MTIDRPPVFEGFKVNGNRDIQEEYQESLRIALQKIIAFDFFRGGEKPKILACEKYRLALTDDLRWLKIKDRETDAPLLLVGLKGELKKESGWRGESTITQALFIVEEIAAFDKESVVALGI